MGLVKVLWDGDGVPPSTVVDKVKTLSSVILLMQVVVSFHCKCDATIHGFYY